MLNGLAKLVERPRPALADLKSILYELLQEGQDFREHFCAYFRLLLKLADVEAENRVLQYPRGDDVPRLLLLLWRSILLGERERPRQYQQQQSCHRFFHRFGRLFGSGRRIQYPLQLFLFVFPELHEVVEKSPFRSCLDCFRKSFRGRRRCQISGCGRPTDIP